jgi:hypothetical protein
VQQLSAEEAVMAGIVAARRSWRRPALVVVAVLGTIAWTYVVPRRITTTVDIPAAPADVWATLTNLAAYPKWNTVTGIEGMLIPGEVITVTQQQGVTARTFTPRVVAVEPERELRWLGRLGDMPGLFEGEHSFTLEAVNGGTRVTQAERFSGLLAPFFFGISDTEDTFHRFNAALAAEAAGPTPPNPGSGRRSTPH